jgi:Secretion system C-terminal sorting domain
MKNIFFHRFALLAFFLGCFFNAVAQSYNASTTSITATGFNIGLSPASFSSQPYARFLLDGNLTNMYNSRLAGQALPSTMSYVDGLANKCLDMTAGSQFRTRVYADDLRATNYTLNFWVKLKNLPSASIYPPYIAGGYNIMSFFSNYSQYNYEGFDCLQQYLDFSVDKNGKQYYTIRVNYTKANTTAVFRETGDKYSMLTLVSTDDGKRLKLYRNGVFLVEAYDRGPKVNYGQESFPTIKFISSEKELDEVTIWDYAFNDSNISSLYNTYSNCGKLDVSLNSNFSSFVSGYNDFNITSPSIPLRGLTPNTTYYCRIKNSAGSVINTFSVKTLALSLKTLDSSFSLNPETTNLTIGKIFPNPSKGFFNLPIILEKTSSISIAIYDFSGKEVLKRNFNSIAPGSHDIALDAHLKSGIYIAKITLDGETTQQRLLID